MIPTTRPTIKPVLLPEDFAAAANGEEVGTAEVEEAKVEEAEVELELEEVVCFALAELTTDAAECAASMKLFNGMALDEGSCPTTPMALDKARAAENNICCSILACLEGFVEKEDVYV